MLRSLVGSEMCIRDRLIDQYGINPISTGYIVCAPGGKVGEVGDADLIQSNDSKAVSAYCKTAEMYGFSTIYLEAGSGASTPVHIELIQAAKASSRCTLIVGGGIRTSEQLLAAANAGADYIVTGTITEEHDSLESLRQQLHSLISVL